MAGDSIGDARLLRRAVALAPADTGIRQSYAEALAWSGDRASAVAQYDTLLAASGSDPDLLIARARLYAVSGDNAAAERDLSEAIAKRPTPEAWVMLGDLYRWEGDRSRAWSAYSEASALRPGDAAAEGGFAELAAAERRQKAAVLSGELGWNTFASYLGDNAGFESAVGFFIDGVYRNRVGVALSELPEVERVEVLPFHQLGQFKWKKLGIPYQLEHTEPPTVDAVEQAVRLFRAEGLTAF